MVVDKQQKKAVIIDVKNPREDTVQNPQAPRPIVKDPSLVGSRPFACFSLSIASANSFSHSKPLKQKTVMCQKNDVPWLKHFNLW